jgi:hypothetical protein
MKSNGPINRHFIMKQQYHVMIDNSNHKELLIFANRVIRHNNNNIITIIVMAIIEIIEIKRILIIIWITISTKQVIEI